MQRRKPMTAKHQERRRRALVRLEVRLDRQKAEPNSKQLEELAALKARLNVA